jgi:hypothetical protein
LVWVALSAGVPVRGAGGLAEGGGGEKGQAGGRGLMAQFPGAFGVSLRPLPLFAA